jgi:hypothetical protein
MDDLVFTIDGLLQRLLGFGGRIEDAIGALEQWLRTQLTLYGVTPMVQIMVLVALTGLVILMTARVPDGLIRCSVILIFVLIGVHFVLPALQQ